MSDDDGDESPQPASKTRRYLVIAASAVSIAFLILLLVVGNIIGILKIWEAQEGAPFDPLTLYLSMLAVTGAFCMFGVRPLLMMVVKAKSAGRPGAIALMNARDVGIVCWAAFAGDAVLLTIDLLT